MEYLRLCVAPESLGYIMVGTLLLVWGQRVIFPATQYDSSEGWVQRRTECAFGLCVTFTQTPILLDSVQPISRCIHHMVDGRMGNQQIKE